MFKVFSLCTATNLNLEQENSLLRMHKLNLHSDHSDLLKKKKNKFDNFGQDRCELIIFHDLSNQASVQPEMTNISIKYLQGRPELRKKTLQLLFLFITFAQWMYTADLRYLKY